MVTQNLLISYPIFQELLFFMMFKLLPRLSRNFQCLYNQSKVLGFSTTSRTSTAVDLSGVFTPVCTPFNKDESIAYDKLEENFQKWNSTKLSGERI